MRAKGVPIAFFDFALNLVCILIAIMVISTMDPPKKASDPAVMQKAEFVIQATWDDGSPDDLDLYLKQPDGQIVYFSNRQTGIAFLDQDNLGRNGNTIALPDGSRQEVPTRTETITIRAIVPGVYTCNLHLYRKSSPAGYVNHAKVKLTKINPFSQVTEAPLDLDTEGQERTAFNFVVEPDGSVSSVYASETKMVGRAKQ